MSLKRIGSIEPGAVIARTERRDSQRRQAGDVRFHSRVMASLTGLRGSWKVVRVSSTPLDVAGIINVGGTILGTSNKGDPFHFPMGERKNLRIVDASDQRPRPTGTGSWTS